MIRTEASAAAAQPARPAQVGLFALTFACAGLPLYIHLPAFAAAELGLPLATVGTILIAIRILDFLQDPALGWVTDRWHRRRGALAALALLLLGGGIAGVFALPPDPAAGPVVPRLVLALVMVFTGYSLGSILFYGESARLAGSGSAAAQYRLAAWREGGALAGVILAAAAPALLAAVAGGSGYAAFGWTVAALAAVTLATTGALWRQPGLPERRFRIGDLAGSGAGWLVGLALVNTLPVALTSTLFLFFVEDRLRLPGLAGPFLILFFLAAGLSVPGWSALARRFGARRVLAGAMLMSVLAFAGTALLPPGAALPFALICLASGATVGADMVILPALFATRLAAAGVQAGTAFGIWSFAGKLALALAAAIALPMLDRAGFVPGGANDPGALRALTFGYAILPCLLKAATVALILTLPRRLFAG
ncbi:MFS transporter [Frigidibacter oleivorans]|uniref:MFS transporter n=1 Tax=Frigidibacter oleivorans TaxID=2487129 RepID=UPI000F8D1A90|nr:MFS transporter [Frigidibacter oleivorans]